MEDSTDLNASLGIVFVMLPLRSLDVHCLLYTTALHALRVHHVLEET